MIKNIKKILYIGSIPPELGGLVSGGVATYCWQLAKLAKNYGYEVQILGNSRSQIQRDGIDIFPYVPTNNLFSKIISIAKGIRFYVTHYKVVRRKLSFLNLYQQLKVCYLANILHYHYKRYHPDILHFHSLGSWMTLSSVLLDINVPIIITHHGIAVAIKNLSQNTWPYETNRNLTIKMVKAVSNKADIIISPSKYAMQSLLETPLNLDPTKNQYVYLPINTFHLDINMTQARKILKLPLDKPIILFVGANHPFTIKGLDILMNVFKNNSTYQNDYYLVSVIDKINYQKIRKIFLPWIKLVSETSLKDLTLYYIASNALVVPSRHEAFCLVYLEALAHGLPIIGYKPSVEELQSKLKIPIGFGFNPCEDNQKILTEYINKLLLSSWNRNLIADTTKLCFNEQEHFKLINSIYEQYAISRKY